MENGFKWETTFSECNKVLTHTFSPRVKVVTDLRNNTLSQYLDDEIKDTISIAELSIESYTQKLVAVHQSAKSLE